MDLHLKSPGMLPLLGVVPFLAVAVLHAHFMRKRALARLADTAMLPRLAASLNARNRWFRSALCLLAVFLLVVAILRPSWDPTVKTAVDSGRDVAVLLDVSRSMLAEDVAPNRLERAKIEVCDVLEGLGGERIGLMVFAGGASVKCPLTQDYAFFRTVLLEQGVESVPFGGSRIGDAMRAVEKSFFRDGPERETTVVLVSDGEDQGSMPLEAAAELASMGIDLIVVGVGDPREGGRIPIVDAQGMRTFLRHGNEEVWSRPNGALLREMAEASSGGEYLQVTSGPSDVGRVLQGRLERAAGEGSRGAGLTVEYADKFQVFLLGAWLLLAMELLISERRRN
jgi:Ca-activated chloride channel family protein